MPPNTQDTPIRNILKILLFTVLYDFYNNVCEISQWWRWKEDCCAAPTTMCNIILPKLIAWSYHLGAVPWLDLMGVNGVISEVDRVPTLTLWYFHIFRSLTIDYRLYLTEIVSVQDSFLSQRNSSISELFGLLTTFIQALVEYSQVVQPLASKSIRPPHLNIFLEF